MNKYAFAAYILIFLLGADVIYIMYVPSLIIPLVLPAAAFILAVLIMRSNLTKKCFAIVNKKMIEKYGPIIMKYMEDQRKECKGCGAILDKNARYCNKCGKKVK